VPLSELTAGINVFWGQFFIHFFSADNSAEFLGKIFFQNFFRGKFHFFPTFLGGKFSAAISQKFSPEKMYEKSAKPISATRRKYSAGNGSVFLQVLMKHAPGLLHENGGPVQLNPTWAKSFLKRMGLRSID
jgi:hypothetical protein